MFLFYEYRFKKVLIALIVVFTVELLCTIGNSSVPVIVEPLVNCDIFCLPL